MTWYTMRYDAIDAFKATWPCHGLPDDLHSLSVETDQRGDVVDIEAYEHLENGSERPIEWRDFDGSAFAALVADCIERGDVTDRPGAPSPSEAAKP